MVNEEMIWSEDKTRIRKNRTRCIDVALAWVADSYTNSFANLLWNWTNEATTTVRIPKRQVDDEIVSLTTHFH